MNSYLVGSGHFTVGFSIGFLVMFFVNKKYHDSLNVQMYSSFIPFVVGIWAALPYLFIGKLAADSSTLDLAWLNIFIFFDLIHHNELVITIFGRLHLVVIICGTMYGYILLRYIRLVKYCQAYGWPTGDDNA